MLSPEWHRDDPVVRTYFKFSVVRNPWDRLISGWRYCYPDGAVSLKQLLRNLPQSGHDFRHVTRPQAAILVDDDGRLVVDYLMRFEELEAGYRRVCRLLQMPTPGLPSLNKTRHDHYRDYYDDESRHLVERAFALDIAMFGYKF